jgi:predicted O-linked N-acetylglucosamine transferase (SPINDLY family)
LADIFLDTSPYGAHTTAAEALGVGVPVITLRGETFASRVAASLLASVGLARLAVDSAGAYERLAIDLGSSPASLARVKKELERARAHAPLFDPGLYCRHLETAYAMAVARHRRGDAPAALLVERRHDGNPIDGAKPTEPGSSGSL